jgi:hypothetical protein
MTIVTARTPKRRRYSAPNPKPVMPAKVVTARKPGRRRQTEPDDPEADAKARAFLERMIRQLAS